MTPCCVLYQKFFHYCYTYFLVMWCYLSTVLCSTVCSCCRSAYDSVDEEDLWQSVAAVADLPVDLEAVMHSWTHQAGYPLVTVVRGVDGCITLTQVSTVLTRFFSPRVGTWQVLPTAQVTKTTTINIGSSSLNFN